MYFLILFEKLSSNVFVSLICIFCSNLVCKQQNQDLKFAGGARKMLYFLREITVFAEGLNSVPSIHEVAHNHL